MSRHIFNEEEKEFMIQNYLKLTNQQISDYFNCQNINAHKVGLWLRNNGYRREKGYFQTMSAPFSENSDQYIQQHYYDMTQEEIGNAIGLTKRQVQYRAKLLHLHKKRSINEHYFDEINTPEKAYWLGFIFADGYLIKSEDNANYELGMELQSRDKYILEELNRVLGGQNIIYHKEPRTTYNNGKLIHGGPSDVLRVYSKNIVNALIKNGVVERKSHHDIVPDVSDEFFFDFLRGYIDGDGCYYKCGNNYLMHITCASKPVLQIIMDRLQKFGIETRIYKEEDRKYRLMCINSIEMKKLISRLYYTDGLFCLLNHYEKVKYYLGLAI